MFAIFEPLQVLAPLESDNVGLHANLRPIGLDHLRHAFGVRVVRPLHRHRPQVNRKTLAQTGILQQLPGFLRRVRIILNLVVAAPLGRRQQVFRLLARTVKHRFDNRRFIHRHRQRLAHFDVIQRFFLGIKRQEADIQAGFLHHLNVRVLPHPR
ncbi:hypothetical protein D3C79_561600 [compost metagenome]